MSRRIAVAAVAAVAAAFAAAPSAQAGLLVATAPSCEANVLTKPFARWLDPFSYTLVPDGGFERGAAGWSLSGARVVNGNETFYVNSRSDSKSLLLPRGSTAVSPVMCAGLDKPLMRFFTKSSGGLLAMLTSTLLVEVLFETSGGQTASLPVGVALSSSRWQPTLPLPVLASLLPLLPGEQTPIAFRFRPLGSATWTIDDVYLDPRHR